MNLGTAMGPLAYVEWFTRPRRAAPGDPLHQVSRSTVQRQYRASIIPVTQIARATHLIPKFGKKCNVQWTSSNVLDVCNTFFVNTYMRYEDFELFN